MIRADKTILDDRLLVIGLTPAQIKALTPTNRIDAWNVYVNEQNAIAQAAEMDRIATTNEALQAAAAKGGGAT